MSLPGVARAARAQTVAKGIVTYPAQNGFANAVQADEQGGARMLTVISNDKAPAAYRYDVAVPTGGKLKITKYGGAILKDQNGGTLATVAKPWAKDANGKPIKTFFSADGTTLIQHVIHNVQGISYPVTADPFWIPAWAVWAIIKCGAGGYLGWIGSGGYRWYERAVAVAGGCFLARRA